MIKLVKNLIPYFKPYKTIVLLGLIFVVLANLFQVIAPWILRLAINGLNEEIQKSQLWEYALLIMSVALLSGFFRFLMRRLIIGVSRDIEFDLRQKIYRHLLEQDNTFYDHARIGDLMTRCTSDVEQVRMVIGPSLMYSVNTLFGLIFSLTLMVMISPMLTLFISFTVPVVSVVVYYLGKKVHQASTASQEAFSDISSIVQESIAGIRVVKTFRQQDEQKSKFEEGSRQYFKKNMKLLIHQGIFIPTIMTIFGLAIAGILLIGGKQIINGNMKIGDFVAFTTYLMILTWPMISIGWVVNMIQRGDASLQRINVLLKEQSSINDPDAPVVISNKEGNLEFRNVCFTYPKAHKTTLKDISFKIDQGENLGIVGRVGSGKSTIISLISRLYDVDQGGIFIDDHLITNFNKEYLRNLISVVPQDPTLFSTTIQDNITMGNQNYTREELDKAIEVSRLIQDLKDFPDGLETEVGERGITLSGGQKQRVAIARAVIRNTPIIILDDALSAVDASTEELILKNFKKYLIGKTSIIVTHRISSVIDAEEILVIDEGEIVERGRHQDLLALQGTYAELFDRDRLKRELEDE